jgi:hypothetical protein
MTQVSVAWDVRREIGSELIETIRQIKPRVLPSEEKPQPPQVSVQFTEEPAEPVYFPKIAYITELPESQYRLKRPIAVFLEQGEEGWLASRDDLGICCYGATVDEALANFALALLDDYDIYASANPNDLTEGARELAEWLREVIERT